MKITFLIIVLCIIAIFAFVSFLPNIVGFDSEDLSVESANQHQATIPAMLNVHHMLKICQTSGTSAHVKDLPHPFKPNSEQPPPQS